MNQNEQDLAAALSVAIQEVNYVAEMIVTEHSEAASLDLLDRLDAGLSTGHIRLVVDDCMFEDGRLCWPPPKEVSNESD